MLLGSNGTLKFGLANLDYILTCNGYIKTINII